MDSETNFTKKLNELHMPSRHCIVSGTGEPCLDPGSGTTLSGIRGIMFITTEGVHHVNMHILVDYEFTLMIGKHKMIKHFCWCLYKCCWLKYALLT